MLGEKKDRTKVGGWDIRNGWEQGWPRAELIQWVSAAMWGQGAKWRPPGPGLIPQTLSYSPGLLHGLLPQDLHSSGFETGLWVLFCFALYFSLGWIEVLLKGGMIFLSWVSDATNLLKSKQKMYISSASFGISTDIWKNLLYIKSNGFNYQNCPSHFSSHLHKIQISYSLEQLGL